MSSSQNRLAIFRKLPLRAQKAFIEATRESPVLAQDVEYLRDLEQIHAQCLANASAEEIKRYRTF
ncbi:MAG: hypothetical protein H7Y22_19785 [Gemmatimonadaceae bacterium]|nr:hypothetical protein [Gloeobacterales cyanobacterium ES-bin-141]